MHNICVGLWKEFKNLFFIPVLVKSSHVATIQSTYTMGEIWCDVHWIILLISLVPFMFIVVVVVSHILYRRRDGVVVLIMKKLCTHFHTSSSPFALWLLFSSPSCSDVLMLLLLCKIIIFVSFIYIYKLSNICFWFTHKCNIARK